MIKILELFSGYGTASFALKKLNLPFKCVGYSDIEDCANYIFALNHGENTTQLGDVTKIDPNKLEDFDLLTGGFPCQSFSIAGKREGFDSPTKGTLFFEIIRIAKIKKPQRMLLENVQGILSHDNGKTMRVVLQELRGIGYKVHWKLLKSKEHSTPQNRPRVWFACFREQEDYDKFMFPEKEKLKIIVKDLLEDEVDKKYYLTEKQLEKFNNRDRYGDHKLNYGDKIHPTLCSIGKSDVAIIPKDFKIADFRYDEGVRSRKDGVCPTLTSTNNGTGLSGQPIIIDNRASETFQSKRSDGISPTLKNSRCNYAINTLTTSYGRQSSSSEFIATSKQINEITNSWRRLTPRECFRLQGFFNDEIKFGNLPDSKLYFLAGNGQDVNVVAKIFKQMFEGNSNKQNGLGSYN